MGKRLIIKGANFSDNALERVATYRNLINPATITAGKYINGSGQIVNPDQDTWKYSVSDYIPTEGKDICCPTAIIGSASSFFGGINVYDASKVLLRNISRVTGQQYTYQEGDAYIRLALRNDYLQGKDEQEKALDKNGNTYPNHFACFGNVREPYISYEE